MCVVSLHDVHSGTYLFARVHLCIYPYSSMSMCVDACCVDSNVHLYAPRCVYVWVMQSDAMCVKNGMQGGREEWRKGGREEGRKGGREERRKGGREDGRKGGGREEGRKGRDDWRNGGREDWMNGEGVAETNLLPQVVSPKVLTEDTRRRLSAWQVLPCPACTRTAHARFTQHGS